VTLNLSAQETRALEDLAKAKDLSQTAVLRQALRLYQNLHQRALRGERLLLRRSDKASPVELVIPDLLG
jgi:hypothetical protein